MLMIKQCPCCCTKGKPKKKAVLFPTAQQPKQNNVRQAMDLSYNTWHPAVTGCEHRKVQTSLPHFTEQLTYLYSNRR